MKATIAPSIHGKQSKLLYHLHSHFNESKTVASVVCECEFTSFSFFTYEQCCGELQNIE